MKKVFKKNQIVIAVLAVMIAAAGYLNYSGKIFGSKNKTAETGSEMANKELLDISDQDTGSDSSLQTADNDQVDGNPGEAVLTNGSVSALVAQAKVNRKQVRACRYRRRPESRCSCADGGDDTARRTGGCN